MAEDNTVFVLQKALKAHKAKVTKYSAAEFLLSHPRYPSLKSICDGLKKWNIDHYPLKLSKEEILELEPPYIAHLYMGAGQLAFVEKTDDCNVTFSAGKGKETVQSKEEFSKRLSGGVIVMEPDKQSGERNYREKWQNELIKAALLPFIIISFVLFGFSKIYSGSSFSDSIPMLLILTKAIGIAASVFLVLHEFKVHTRIADKICGFSSGIDCDSVLASNISKIYGNINLSDIGIVYFTSTLLYILGTAALYQLWLLAVVSAFSLVFPVYSIYYQGFRLKKWCPFCLVVQAVLIAEFFILFPLLGLISISIVDLLRLAAFLTLVTAVWILYKSYFELSESYSNEHYTFLRFKSTPGIFKFLLQKNGYTGIPENPGSLVFGNPDARVTVTAFLSLSCNPCAGAFKEIKDLIDNTDQVKVNIVLSVSPDEQSQKLAGQIYRLYNTEEKEKALEFIFWWYTATKDKKRAMRESLSDGFPEIEKIAKNNNELFEKVKIPGTPTVFVNGYKFPKEYQVSDIDYFKEGILSLTMESKGQEACSHCR
ncbi:MAG: vitamin K epoxide reductase family protein [Bacteroidales bacterium]